MKGVIFNALEQMVSEKIGVVAMEEIYNDRALFDQVPFFVGPETYPDQDFVKLLGAVAIKLDTPVQDLIFEYGKYLFSVLARRFPIFLENIPSPILFLGEVNDIVHVEVNKLFDEAVTPEITLTCYGEDEGILEYRSERQLCTLLEGLVTGLGAHFGKRVAYSHRQCMKNGAESCILDLQFISSVEI